MLRIPILLAASLLSAMPVLWMAILFLTQSNNFFAETPYRDEFPNIVLFWVGFVAACAFAYSGFTRTLSARRILVLGPLVALGIVGGVMEEIKLLHDAKIAFPIGFFELAPLCWVAAGISAKLWPNKVLKNEARKSARAS
jgi:hypothetical protein